MRKHQNDRSKKQERWRNQKANNKYRSGESGRLYQRTIRRKK